jgi:hypothetical protein
MTVDNLCLLEERLEAKNNEPVDSRLGQFEFRLDQLSGKVTAVYGTYCQPSVGSDLNRVNDTNDHARSIPTSVPSTMSKSQSNCRCDNNNDNNKQSLSGRPRRKTLARVNLPVKITW